MFELTTATKAKLSNVNVRSELHGKDAVPAVDLKIDMDMPNSVLSMFDPWLLSALYHNAEAREGDQQQTQLEGVPQVSDVPNLRMEHLASPVRWTKEFTGYTLTLDYGTGGKSNIVLTDCSVNQIAFACKEGGTVTLSVRVQAQKSLTEKILGKLATLVQHDVHVLLEPPKLGNDDGGTTPIEALAGAAGAAE